ncbi:MAG: hypothetical protein KME17_27465 [Cyanosarcina radialis HA8281-LM2]|nr:hypothetical protein [Cyanosarcina radialis HA8281-LM2]
MLEGEFAVWAGKKQKPIANYGRLDRALSDNRYLFDRSLGRWLAIEYAL